MDLLDLPLPDQRAERETGTPPGTAAIATAGRAAERIAPLWPLARFVAVNPFLGLSDVEFATASGMMARAAGARMTMPRSWYEIAIAEGRIADTDLAAALAEAAPAPHLPADVAGLKAAARHDAMPPSVLPTVADIATSATGVDFAHLAVERISVWAAGWFDMGQAAWHGPGAQLPAFQAWREEACLDRTPELMGLPGFRRIIASLPDTAEQAIIDGVARLGLGPHGLDAWLHRLLMTIGGWAGHARYRRWQAELQGGTDSALDALLAIRVCWEVGILEALRARPGVLPAWAAARAEIAAAPDAGPHAVDAILQAAHERAWQRRFFARLAAGPEQGADTRPAVQAVFCIDVRSEVFRRALESVSPAIDTIGFAGFFGLPIEYVPFGQTSGPAHCPVLLAPAVTVRETVARADQTEEAMLLERRRLRRRAAKAWKSFKLAAVSCFGFVDTMGWTYLGKLASDALGLTRPVPHPATDNIDAATRRRLRPSLAPDRIDGRPTGVTAEARLDLAEAALKAMSMRAGFARLVLLTGHGATMVNNPHAAGLDCGACGGQSGEASARVAAAILNDAEVRRGLAARGIDIPADTVFLAGLHDTTTDTVTLFDEDAVPSSHDGELDRLRGWLDEAAARTRLERAGRLRLDPSAKIDAAIRRRSRDWSQTRPEWGLAGCAAFIAAPRARLRGIDLQGRAFLHSYDWRQDAAFATLESIMTAPMIVASWISLQYYGSSVDNRVFGCGNKVLHNVVGTLGVLEGNGGDLRAGLPWQSVHDGEALAHEPLRLSVVIDAPTTAIDEVIARHDSVRNLVDNRWIHLFAFAPDGSGPLRRRPGAGWDEFDSTDATAAS